MNIVQSLGFFGLPGLAILGLLWFGVPLADAHGVPLIVSWTIGLWAPILAMLGWVLFASSARLTRVRFRARFRLRPLGRADWLWIVAAVLAVQALELALSGTGRYLATATFLAPPPVTPEIFDPAFDPGAGLTTFMGQPVLGNWWLVLFWLGWLVVNIGGEELLWRGYALPLQERAIGKYAWLVNGLCWNLLIHAFMAWTMIVLIPISLIVPYLVQRRQNTWIGIAIHGFGNALVLALLIPSIMGAI